MENNAKLNTFPPEAVFALDIGTRSIIGMVGIAEKDKVRIIAVEEAIHSRRTMVDGQIENIDEVARLAAQVREKLENKTGYLLRRVCVAAAGRALRIAKASSELEFPEVQYITDEIVSQLENGAIEQAERNFLEENEEEEKRYYLVGYTVSQYYIDNYMISSLKEHRGKKIKADVVATFLPGEVVESLYTAMSKAGMEVASLTLEPIAAINAAIPEDLRLLNLVMVDIGAGTSDIAVCRDGKVVGYTMATLAGDEITEALMKELLVDFNTAEKIKMQLSEGGVISYTDILGFEQQADAEAISECLGDIILRIGEQIAQRIIEVNTSAPSALFLAGGGSRTSGLKEKLAECLGMDAKRVSVAGRHFGVSAFSDNYDLQDPKYTTPLGIVVSAGLNMINDSYSIKLNGNTVKLFSNGSMTLTNILLMNGYMYRDLLGKSGANISVIVNGKRVTFYGEKGIPAVLELNGRDAGMNDIVHAGDEIIFHPALHGKAAKASLYDIAGLEDADSVKVNGKEAESNMPLSNGDVIEILKHEEPEPIQVKKPEDGRDEEQEKGSLTDTVSHPADSGPQAPVWQEEKPLSAAALGNESMPAFPEPVMPAASSAAQAAAPAAPFIATPTAPQSVASTAPYATAPTASQSVAPSGPYTAAPSTSQSVAPAVPQPSAPAAPYAAAPTAPQSVAPSGPYAAAPTASQSAAPAVPQPSAPAAPYATAPSASQSAASAAPQPSAPTGPYIAAPTASQSVAPAAPYAATPTASQSAAAGSAGAPFSAPPVQRRNAAPPGPAGNVRYPGDGIPASAPAARTDPTGTYLNGAPRNNAYASPAYQNTGAMPAPPENAAETPVIRFELNGRPLMLRKKADGSPYFLMDMLEFSGIDFEHVSAPVTLEVNGVTAPFQQELRNNDRISIYERKDT